MPLCRSGDAPCSCLRQHSSAEHFALPPLVRQRTFDDVPLASASVFRGAAAVAVVFLVDSVAHVHEGEAYCAAAGIASNFVAAVRANDVEFPGYPEFHNCTPGAAIPFPVPVAAATASLSHVADCLKGNRPGSGWCDWPRSSLYQEKLSLYSLEDPPCSHLRPHSSAERFAPRPLVRAQPFDDVPLSSAFVFPAAVAVVLPTKAAVATERFVAVSPRDVATANQRMIPAH